MRIAFFSTSIGDAFGQEKVMRESAELLQRAGHELYFFGCRQNGPLPAGVAADFIPELDNIRFGSDAKQAEQARAAVLKKVRAWHPDIVHLIELPDWKVLHSLCAEFPVVYTAHLYASSCPSSLRAVRPHGICLHQSGWGCLAHHVFQQCLNFPTVAHRAIVVREYLRKRKALQGAKALVAISQSVRDVLLRDGWPSEKVHLIYNPIRPLDGVTPDPMVPKNLLLVASRLERHKGIGFLLQALAGFKGEEWSLWICGEGSQRESLEAQVQSTGLQDRVRFLGRTSYPRTLQLMASSLAVLQPNLGPEPFGLSVAEACQLGRPVIVTAMPALNEVVAHEENGLLFPVADAEALRLCVRRLISEPGLAERLGANGPKRMQRNFSAQDHLARTLHLYESVLGITSSTSALSETTQTTALARPLGL